MSSKNYPSPEGKKIIDDIHNHLQQSNLFEGKDLPNIPNILEDLERELDNTGGQWSGIEILKVIKDHMRRYDTSDVLIKGLALLAQQRVSKNRKENSITTKQIVDNINNIERTSIHAEWDREIIFNILRTVANITNNDELNKEIEKAEGLLNRFK